MRCQHCQVKTDNPKFCSRSCATSYNNSIKPKRKRSGNLFYNCSSCGKDIISKYQNCRECSKEENRESWLNKTLDEVYGPEGNSRFSQVGSVRILARKIYFKSMPSGCRVCGYNLHVEVCHIIPISEFPRSATVAEVNDLSNLVGLCRNHHWELDNGFISESAWRDSNSHLLDS